MSRDGSAEVRLTKDVVGDHDPSVPRTARTSHGSAGSVGPTFGIYRVSVDGSSVVELTRGQPGTNEYPSP